MICLFLKNKIHHLKLEIVSEIPASNEFKIWSFLLIELCFLMMNDECDFLQGCECDTRQIASCPVSGCKKVGRESDLKQQTIGAKSRKIY